jgi:ribonuclease HI
VQRFTDGDSFLEMVLTVGETSFSLLNFYSPGHPKHIAQLLTTRFPIPPESCILLGDLNAHHPWWSAQRDLDSAARRKSSRESNVLAAWLEQHHFTLHNQPGIPTHFPDRIGDSTAVPSVIDLALSRGAIRDRVTSWAIDEAPPSDHRTIALYLDVGTPAAADPIQYQDWRSADWRLFDDHIRRLDIDNLEPSNAISAISQGISDAVAAAVPLRTRRTDPRVPWWHPDLERISIKVKRAKRRIRDNPNPSAGSLPLPGQAMVLHGCTCQGRLSRAQTRRDRPSQGLEDNQASPCPSPPARYRQLTVPRTSRRNAMPSGMRCSRPLIPPPEVLPPDFVCSKADIRDEFHAVSRAEVDRVIARLNYGSAVGPDKISYEAVCRFHACLPHVLPKTFTDLFASAIHPTEWKDAHCVVITKPGKRTYQTVSAYRPISLLSCFGKVFEAIAARRLSKAAAACGAISNAQMGARGQHSTLDALLRVVDPIAYSLSQMHGILHSYSPRPGLLAHDIAGAFNNTHPALLDQALEQRCIPTYLRNWTRAFNENHRLSFELDSRIEEPQPFRCGLPQGSPISPILFLIYANAALENADKAGAVTDTSYVDDVSIVAAAPRPNAVIDVLQKRTNEQMRHVESLRLSFALGKSELLLFLPASSNRHTDLGPSRTPQSQLQTVDLTVGHNVIQPLKVLKYLGVTIDDALGFKTHAAAAAAKGVQAIRALSFLRRHDWSAPAYVVDHLAFATVMPKMLWGSPIWWTRSVAVQSVLAAAYHRIARWITGLPMSTKISKLLTAAQLPPLDAYLDYLSMRYAIRVRFLPADHILADSPEYIRGKPKPELPSRHRLDSLISHLTVGKLEDRSTPVDTSIPWIESPHRDKHTDPTGIHVRWIQSLPDFTILLYTDGSKLKDGRTGSGWVTHCVGNGTASRLSADHCHLGTRAEVFDAELHAAQEARALTALQHLDTPVATAYLCIDNQSALDTLHGNASQTQYSWSAAATAAELHGIGWKILGIWTPAHVGVVGNETADSEAKAGAASASSAACTHTRTTKTWMLTQTRKRLRERWLAALPDAIPSMRFPDHLRHLRWPATRALWRLYAGRMPSDRDPGADHDKDPEPCDCGESFASSAHILLECRLFSRACARMLQKAPDVTVTSILHPTHLPAVMEFMKTTGLGYTGKLYGGDGEERGEERRRGERRRGGDGYDGGEEGGSDGGGGERGEEGGGSDREGVDEAEGEEAADVSDGEWKFGLFE